MDQIGVYQIINTINNYRYVGSTTRGFNRRWATHLCCLRKNKHENTHLQRAYNKYGEGSFVFLIIETVNTPENCIDIEQKWIDSLKPEYNMCPNARNCLGRNVSKETRKKISLSNTGRKHTKDFIEKARIAMMGNDLASGAKRTEEFKQNLREKNAGRNNNFFGKKHTEETKAIIKGKRKLQIITEETRSKKRESMKWFKHTEESKKKISEAKKGRVFTQEHIAKLRKSHEGFCVSEETRIKIGLANKGKILSEETKRKISESKKISHIKKESVIN